MKCISVKIKGVPYGRNKSRGDKDAPGRWTDAVIEQTQGLPKINEACMLKVTFFLPPDKFPSDFPYGSDLDNLLKRFCDALNKTVFSESPGKDSCVINLTATKAKVNDIDAAGAYLEILPVSVT